MKAFATERQAETVTVRNGKHHPPASHCTNTYNSNISMTMSTTRTHTAPEGPLNFKAALLRLVPRSRFTKSKASAEPGASSPTHSSPRIASYWKDAQDATRIHSFEQARPTVDKDDKQAGDTDVLERVLMNTTRELEVTSEVSIDSLKAKEDTVGTVELRREVDVAELFQNAINSATPKKATAPANDAKPLPGNAPLRRPGSSTPAPRALLARPVLDKFNKLHQEKLLPGNAPLPPAPGTLRLSKIAGVAQAPKAVSHRPAPSPPDALASKKRAHGKENFSAAPCPVLYMHKCQDLERKLDAGTLSFEDELVVGRLIAGMAFGCEHRQTQSGQTSTSSPPREQEASRVASKHQRHSYLQQLLRHKVLGLVQSAASHPQARECHIEALPKVEDKNTKPYRRNKMGTIRGGSPRARSVRAKSSAWVGGKVFLPMRRSQYLEDQSWYLTHLTNLKNSRRPVTDPALNPFAEPLERDFKLASCEPRVEEGEFQRLRWVFSGPQMEKGSGVLIAGMAPAPEPLMSYESNLLIDSSLESLCF